MYLKKIQDILKKAINHLNKGWDAFINLSVVKKIKHSAIKAFHFIDRYIKFDKQPTKTKAGIVFAGVAVGLIILWVIARLGGLIVYNACVVVVDSGVKSRFMKRTKASAIEAAKVVPGSISRRIQTVGQLRPNNIVTLKSEVNGRITEIPVKEGSEVKKGDLLIQFDNADAVAELKDAEATLALKEADFKRMEALKNVVATNKIDEARAGFAIAEAKVATAKARLEKTQIRAPFDGVIGLIEQSPGTYVQAGTELATVVENNPMKVDFKIPERNLHEVGVGQAIDIRLDGFPDQIFTGTVEAIDSKVDTKSHSIAVRGTIPNPKHLLRGGVFANVSLIVGEKGDALLVPESALEREGDIEYVWVVKRGKASRKRVLVGSKENNKVEIITGIEPGSIVVTAGQTRFAGDGHPVKILNLNEDGTEKPEAEKKKIEDVSDEDDDE